MADLDVLVSVEATRPGVSDRVGFGAPGGGGGSGRPRLSWWRELVLAAVVYVGYSVVRNQFGSAHLDHQARVVAFDNALRVIDVERALGIFHELGVQRAFVHTWVTTVFNLYYGIAHAAVTVGLLVWLLMRRREVFRWWRSVLVVTTLVGLVGYGLFPLMPPRLVGDSGPYGGASLAAGAGIDVPFVDTLRDDASAWSFESGTVQLVSNQYAAMPSLHMAWAAWCAWVIIACGRWGRRRWLALIHPVVTLVAIIATANHYFLDAVAGLVALGLGWGGALIVERIHRSIRRARTRPAATEPLLNLVDRERGY